MKYQTPLCEIAYKYGSDKCRQLKHPYTPFYYELLKNRRHSIKKVLEIGVGHAITMPYIITFKGSYQTGASLYMWRDFFPKAEIYGTDILPEAMVKDDRITTYLSNQTNKADLFKLIRNVGRDIDLVIDDGSHKWPDQVFTCLTLMPLLPKKVCYVIEDVKYPDLVIKELSGFNCSIPDIPRPYRDSRLVLVKNK